MITTLFKTSVYVTQYPNPEEIFPLFKKFVEPLPFSRYCNEVVTNSPPLAPGVDSTTQHWLKKDSTHPPEFLHKNPKFSKILDFMHLHAKTFWNELGYDQDLTPVIGQSWVQRYPGNTQGLAVHNHSNIPLVGSFCFVGGPDQGNIAVQDPLDMLMSQLHYLPWGRNSRFKSIETVTGTFVLMPGYLNHCVTPNTTNLTRYTWNMDFVVPFGGAMTRILKTVKTQAK